MSPRIGLHIASHDHPCTVEFLRRHRNASGLSPPDLCDNGKYHYRLLDEGLGLAVSVASMMLWKPCCAIAGV